MNNVVATNNTNDLANFFAKIPQSLQSNYLWMPVAALSIGYIIKVLADNNYDFSGNIKEGDFSLHRHTEQLVH